MKNRDIYWRIYKNHCTEDNDTSVPFEVGTWDLTKFSESPSAVQSYFLEYHQWSEISSLSKVILVLGKARSCRVPNLGYSGTESPGRFYVSLKHSAWDVMHEQAHCHDEAANHQLPTAAGFWITQIVSTRNVQAKCKIWCRFFALVSCFECDSYTVHMLTQWHLLLPLTSTVKSSLFTHARSSPLSLAARLHWCHTNHSCVNNDGTFSRQTSYIR